MPLSLRVCRPVISALYASSPAPGARYRDTNTAPAGIYASESQSSVWPSLILHACWPPDASVKVPEDLYFTPAPSVGREQKKARTSANGRRYPVSYTHLTL